jgi:hypothetical protein
MHGNFRTDAHHLGERLKSQMGDADTVKSEGKLLDGTLPIGVSRRLAVKLIDLAGQIDCGNQRPAGGVVHFQA